MIFQIYSGPKVIGSSDLDRLDPPMGIASGDFLPSENYYRVQPVFRLYAEDASSGAYQSSEVLERYYRERDGLDLTVRLTGGEIVPVQWVHIEDFSVELGEMQITVVAADWQTFVQYSESQDNAERDAAQVQGERWPTTNLL